VSDAPRRLEAWERELATSLASGNSARWQVLCYAELASTMEPARELAAKMPDGCSGLVLTRVQSAGRGRQGRTWVAPAEGFFATYVFTARCEPSAASGFSLAAGVAARAALARFGASVWLKWPNDLMTAEGAKLGGILIELLAGERTAVLCGIGINLRGAPRIDDRSAPVASVDGCCARAPTALELSAPLGRELREAWITVTNDGFARVRDEWMRSALFVGERLTVDCGDEKVSGTFVEIDLSGRLVLDGPRGRRTVVAGHVLLEK
jgi:BirA family biotin operon repressor/biotin-[acetyl-CoA-carboxylase] ligase